MSNFLVKLFIKNYKDVNNPSVREKYGLLSGFVGILVNVILTVGKFIIGSVTHSIAITADAFNNLSDAGSCIVTLVGFKLSSAKPDKEHPFGHGRIEYIAALIIGFIVELMGFELIKSSIEKIKNPEPLIFSAGAVIVLLFSIAGKLWLALFNRNLGKRIDSPALSAAVTDSIGDITATSFTLLALILSRFIAIPLDGIFGISVALFIMYSGLGILKETIGFLLGKPPSKELVKQLVDFICSYDGVLGVHDLIIHSYGAGTAFASVHIELPSDMNLIDAHEKIDEIEKEVLNKFEIMLVAHLDPLVINDEKVNFLKYMMQNIVKDIDAQLSIHDFRVVDSANKTTLIFDLVIPYGYKYKTSELSEILQREASKQDKRYVVCATIESELS